MKTTHQCEAAFQNITSSAAVENKYHKVTINWTVGRSNCHPDNMAMLINKKNCVAIIVHRKDSIDLSC